MNHLVIGKRRAGGPSDSQDACRAPVDVLHDNRCCARGQAQEQMPSREISGLGVVLEIGLPGLLPGCAGSVTGQGVAAGDQPASERAPVVGKIQVG